MKAVAKIYGILATLIVTALAGCNANGCMENQNAIPLAGIYSSTTGNQISIDSVEIGAPGDSLLTYDVRSFSQIYLPLRSKYDTASFYILYTQKAMEELGITDTITFTYTSLPYFASEECGATYRYHITGCRYTRNLLDSVAVTDSLITNIDLERIRIYFRTVENEQQ